jgi:hypothetical protein
MVKNNGQIRIALVTYAMHCGGGETFPLYLGKYLLSVGYVVDIVVTEEKGEWFNEIENSGCRSIFIKGADFLKKFIPFGDILFSIRVGNKLRHKKYDIILLNNSRYAQASLKLFNNRSHVVTILHNDQAEIYAVGLANTSE